MQSGYFTDHKEKDQIASIEHLKDDQLSTDSSYRAVDEDTPPAHLEGTSVSKYLILASKGTKIKADSQHDPDY